MGGFWVILELFLVHGAVHGAVQGAHFDTILGHFEGIFGSRDRSRPFTGPFTAIHGTIHGGHFETILDH